MGAKFWIITAAIVFPIAWNLFWLVLGALQ